MTTLFLIVCASSVVFFLVFFVQCWGPRDGLSKPERKSRLGVARRLSQSEVMDRDAGHGSLADMEKQMTDFLSARFRTRSIIGSAAHRRRCRLGEVSARRGLTSPVVESISPIVAGCSAELPRR